MCRSTCLCLPARSPSKLEQQTWQGMWRAQLLLPPTHSHGRQRVCLPHMLSSQVRLAWTACWVVALAVCICTLHIFGGKHIDLTDLICSSGLLYCRCMAQACIVLLPHSCSLIYTASLVDLWLDMTMSVGEQSFKPGWWQAG